VLDLHTEGKAENVLIREVQWDHLGEDVLHVDFIRVSRDERIHISIPLEIKGIAPGVTGGGVLDQPIHTLHVECLALAIPGSVRVNINELQIGAAIYVKDLKVPEGVVVLDDPEAIVVQIKAPQAEEEAPAEAGTAEPEVIGRAKEEEEEKEEK
jgi:large subunit ribosomal protein L25